MTSLMERMLEKMVTVGSNIMTQFWMEMVSFGISTSPDVGSAHLRVTLRLTRSEGKDALHVSMYEL